MSAAVLDAAAAARPLVRLRPGQERRLKHGHPWAFSNEVAMTEAARDLPPGAVVRLEGDDGWRLGTFMFNPHSLIAARRLEWAPDAAIGPAWLAARLRDAAALRERLQLGPFCRLVHAEADGLPGLVVDRHDDVLVLQANTAFMDRHLSDITAALREQLQPRAVVARNDSAVRAHEGLPETVLLLHGDAASCHVVEDGVRFPIDPLSGQKTGWFYDQRPNRDRVAALSGGARVLDVFCHTGAFGLRAARAGAAAVLLVDSSAPALAAASAAAEANGLAVATRRGDAFDEMASLAQAGESFDVVVCDPPAFAKSRKDAAGALRAYGRMARLAGSLVARGGFLFVASCSHHAEAASFYASVAEGLFRARRESRVIWSGGAGPDHPVHPMLPESAYLKAQLLQVL